MFPPSVIEVDHGFAGNRRSRKKSQTRSGLTHAAIRLFAEHGYDKTSISQITDAIDVSPRTFFRYFASKEDVLFPSVDHGPYLARVRAQPIWVNDVDAVRDAYLSMLPLPAEVAERTLLFKRALARTPALQGRNLLVQQEFRDDLAKALSERRKLAAPDDAVVVAASMAQVAMRIAFDRWVDSDGRSDLAGLLRNQFELVHEVAAPSSRTGNKGSREAV